MQRRTLLLHLSHYSKKDQSVGWHQVEERVEGTLRNMPRPWHRPGFEFSV